jgi:hypothetical protein
VNLGFENEEALKPKFVFDILVTILKLIAFSRIHTQKKQITFQKKYY